MSTDNNSVKIIGKEDFRRCVLNYDLPFSQRLALVKEEFDLEMPDHIEDGEPFLDLVYSKYMNMVNEFQLMKNVKYSIQRNKENPTESKKSFIVKTIFESKNGIFYKELYDTVDVKFEYSKYGQSPRTRLRKVIEELTMKNLIEDTMLDGKRYLKIIKAQQ
ncbi:MAG TPA: hypothetical protein VI815_02710 [Candidatus Nanoarchaeia archaeon]|nr:hypothetical protein [Candidatus Nanoarchaeia archaeon]